MQQKLEQNTEKTTRTVLGTVASIKMDKTIVVVVTRRVKHPKYNKYITRKTKLYAHDETNQAKLDDTVIIELTRPISKKKCWQLVQIMN